jgi:hypothetical protein
MLEYMCQQFEQLEIVHGLPENLQQRESVVNRAMDVRSACMVYLAAHISHDATLFGTLGMLLFICLVN